MGEESHRWQRRKFAILLAVVEVAVTIFYGIFMKVQAHANAELNQNYYPMYQDVNVMMLIGFGFLMTFIKNYTWSTLAYTFFVNAVVVQLYILFQTFWHTVFHSDGYNFNIAINEKNFTAASYSVASMLIAFGAVIGKVGPFELLIIAILGVFGYTLNEDIVYNQLKLFDAGGSTAIHTFGAYYGLVVSFCIGRTDQGKNFKPVHTTKLNSTFSLLGTLFLWMFWPSFNAGYFSITPLEKSLVIGNTIISLTASCLVAFILSHALRQKFSIQDIINATLAGGVIIGAPSGLITNPAAAFAIGCVGGALSTYCFYRLGPKLEKFFHIHDSCGVHNLHGIPGILGGILSGVVIASYNAQGIPASYQTSLPYSNIGNTFTRTYTQQAAIQVAGTFLSLGIGVFVGLMAGLVIYCLYSSQSRYYFKDALHFEIPQAKQNDNGNRKNTKQFTQQQLIEPRD